MNMHRPRPSAPSCPGPRRPLPTFWPFGRRFRGKRIDLLPTGYIDWEIDTSRVPPLYLAALLAERDLRVMAADQLGSRC